MRGGQEMREVIGIILAGGVGERLRPLTNERAKPAVPFGGKYRIIDFVINNFINSGIQNVKILVQTLSQSLIDHVSTLWPSMPVYNYYVQSVPAQRKISEDWYKSTADAVFQNLNIFKDNPQYDRVAIFSGDHVFKMDVSQMDRFHLEKDSDFTIAAMVIRSEEAGRFGIIEVDEHGRIVGFEEKPKQPKEIPGKPGYCLTSMGNYMTNTSILIEILKEDAKIEGSTHDFGKDVIPLMLKKGHRMFAYNFADNRIPGERGLYWRDVGTIRSYWEANMDLVGLEPELNLYNELWPVKTVPDFTSPAKWVFRQPVVDNVIISGGCIVTQSEIDNSVLSQKVRVEKGAIIQESVIFAGVTIGEGSRVRRAIIDKNVNVPSFTQIGFSVEEDQARGFKVFEGITVVPKGYVFS
jgi:glucose-1-phosphate adenylyltransferase